MADRRRERRTRIVALAFVLLNAVAIAFSFILVPPQSARLRAHDDDPVPVVAAAAQAAVDSHPFGDLLVPYEHRELSAFVADAAHDPTSEATLSRRAYAASATHVFYIVLGEMTLLLAGMYALGLIGAALALTARPGLTIAGAVLMLLAAPVPVVSVGPGSAILTSYLFVGGLVLLLVRPRFARPDVSPESAAVMSASGRSQALVGVVLLIAGAALLVVAAGMPAARFKLWLAAVGGLVSGLVALVWGLVTWLRYRG